MKEHLKVVAEWLGCIAACVALGAAPVLMDTDEPEPPQAAEWRALMDARQQQREFNEWRESQSRQSHQLAKKGETK